LPLLLFFALFLFLSCVSKNDKNSDQTGKRSDSVIYATTTANPYAAIDISPMAMSYFPVNYSQKKNDS